MQNTRLNPTSGGGQSTASQGSAPKNSHTPPQRRNAIDPRIANQTLQQMNSSTAHPTSTALVPYNRPRQRALELSQKDPTLLTEAEVTELASLVYKLTLENKVLKELYDRSLKPLSTPRIRPQVTDEWETQQIQRRAPLLLEDAPRREQNTRIPPPHPRVEELAETDTTSQNKTKTVPNKRLGIEPWNANPLFSPHWGDTH
ncbi:MAG: hypothetical protein K2Y01_06515 [Rhabdochlamydiaceae bacterium]|nr:hypothetical protein [Rhabdochlamydiaceae bacterium]